MSTKIVTVRGPIDPDDLGVCLVHEHFVVDTTVMAEEPTDPDAAKLFHTEMTAELSGILSRNPVAVRANLMPESHQVLVDELDDYRALGGRSAIEVTPVGLGRDPLGVRRLSEATGLHVVAGSAQYVAGLQPPWVHEASVDEIAEWFRREASEGIDGTDVKPGILGELGVSLTLEPSEEKVLRAAARVHVETGLAITLHTPTPAGAAQAVDVLEEAGVDLTRVVVGHADVWLSGGDEALDRQREIIRRGCFLAFDTFYGETRFPPFPLSPAPMWTPGDGTKLRGLLTLLEGGHAGQLLVSQDCCMRMHLLRYGGTGYGNILRTIIPDLLAFGVDQAGIDQILVDNPRRLLAY